VVLPTPTFVRLFAIAIVLALSLPAATVVTQEPPQAEFLFSFGASSAKDTLGDSVYYSG
jgi:hypothetical protein